jgi:hypothetical protein
MLRQHLTSEALTNLLPFVLAVLAAIGAALFSLPNGKNLFTATGEELLRSAALGSAVGIFLFILADRAAAINSTMKSIEREEQQFSKLEDLIAGDEHLICLGHPGEAIARISSSIPQATLAWNTFISYGTIDSSNYDETNRALVVEGLRKFFQNRTAKWIDVISDPDSEIRERMKMVFSDSSITTQGYSCYKLREGVPFINFLVLDFGGARSKEVFFGFGRHSYDEVGDVFYSTGKKIVELFEKMALHS